MQISLGNDGSNKFVHDIFYNEQNDKHQGFIVDVYIEYLILKIRINQCLVEANCEFANHKLQFMKKNGLLRE